MLSVTFFLLFIRDHAILLPDSFLSEEKPMTKKATIYDIAREAGVSTATVTRVVRKDPHVKEATRLKVQQVIDAHAYSPSISAQNLEGGRSRTLAVVLPVISNLYFNRIFDAAWWEAEKNGCSLRLFQTMENQAISPGIVSELIRCRMDGVLFAGSIWSEDRGDLNTALEKLGKYMPVATICPPDVSLDCICIQSDLVNCSRLPVRHLHTLGHRRIAFLGGSMHSKDTSRRGVGFLEQLRRMDLPDDPAYHVDAGYDMESGERAVLRMLSGLDRNRWPTAIVTFNDLVALGVMKQLKKMGLTLPEDMAIIGCDNQFFCAYTDPALTSVDLHPEEMARSAVRELLLARESSSRSFAMVREATLIVRESCGVHLGFRKL